MPDSLSETVRAALAKATPGPWLTPDGWCGHADRGVWSAEYGTLLARVEPALPAIEQDGNWVLVVNAPDWLAALCDDTDRLRALLREYGRHAEGCSAALNDSELTTHAPARAYRCRCGWDEAEKTLEGTR